ncbi:flagellar brake protein [Massilia sp. PAMC28688]|uniref:flagellar brake protein n=1 Tax=Massilia sp. PAMC28688 TaxID=2861283 RepID=UPI001C635A41|nr:flagellar brake protein [Massilia sp. PAMC28688]QYF92033.1 flagellar brake protein [Massilia sp. PAMC28688]
MQTPDDTRLENWHDFEVDSRREIVALLRAIGEKNQLIRMLVHGEADVCVTSILDVDPDSNTVYFDCSIDPEQNRRILQSKRLQYETTLDKIRILFSTEGQMQSTTHNGGPALVAEIPPTLIRLQRREFYRMATPVSNPVRAIIPLPPELGGGSTIVPLADISCGGIAILDNKLVLGSTMGLTYRDCKIDLPEIGMVSTGLQVRNALEMTLLNNKTNRRLGCEFIDISRGNLAMVQRYITKLERERNARVAGLS